MTRHRQDYFEARGTSNDLVVMIHGFNGDADSFVAVRDAMRCRDEFRNTDLFAPALYTRFSWP
jgi:hypothetical protein